MAARNPKTGLLAGALVVGVLLAGTSAEAQDVSKAVETFRRGDFESAATQFYSVLRLEPDEDADIYEAQYGLAKSFSELGLNVAALKYWEDILRVGGDHPYFRNAIAGMLDTGDALRDDLKTPQVLDAAYSDANEAAIKVLDGDVRQRLNAAVGKYVFTRGDMPQARQFLNTVKPGNPAYAQAQYILGLIRLGVGRADRPKVKYAEAFQNFENARNAIPKETDILELQNLRDLATLAIARSYYEQAYAREDGDPERKAGINRAMLEFQRVPRFSSAWPEALFERAWANTVSDEYGRALGALHSLNAPYFQEEFYPEASILKAIIYYYNCQWDRVNKVLDETKGMYEPMAEQMSALIEADVDLDAWYPLLQRSLANTSAARPGESSDLIPLAVARAIARDPKFVKMEGFLRQIDTEASYFSKSAAFSKSDMGQEMTAASGDLRDAYLGVIGKYLKTKMADLTVELNDITTRASIVSLETREAEVQWLEQGRAIDNQIRKRQPRPFIPDDTFQFWWFRDEFWIDELGYYEFTIKTECYE